MVEINVHGCTSLYLLNPSLTYIDKARVVDGVAVEFFTIVYTVTDRKASSTYPSLLSENGGNGT